ncbi:MAG: hypothetical protein K8J31_31365 [Anaerolineae bacterium]|nr:hypothetical protein [Anaerolineae bacterium]
MSTADLPVHVKNIKKSLEAVWPSIRKAGSDEQRQLLGAMYDSLTLAERLYYEIPQGGEAVWNQWRHDVIRPLSLCINSAELLLTDTESPLNAEQRDYLDSVYNEAMQLSTLIDDIHAQSV